MKLLIFILIFSTACEGQVIRANPLYRPFAVGSSCSYLLDQYSGATAAYSLRKLDCDYSGSAIRVRRSSDNTEQDIGFTSAGDLDTATLKTFVGTGGADDGFVVTWYDQSGNSNDATQSTAVNQPSIMDNGIILRAGANPTVYFNGSKAFSLTSTLAVNADFSVFGVQARSTTSNSLFIFANSGSGEPYNALQFTDGNVYFTTNSAYVGGADAVTGIRLFSSFRASSTLTLYRNGASVSGLSGAVSGSTTYNRIAVRNAVSFATGNISEAIYFNSDKSASRTGIESNINSYYTIY